MGNAATTTFRKREAPAAMRIWRRLPVVVRAVLVGALVALLGQVGTASAMVANLRLLPGVPWSLPVAAIWLWLFWSYINGRGWPRGTSARRRELLRATPLSARLWGWSLLTCSLLLAFGIALRVACSRLQPVSPALPEALLALPPVTLVPVLLLIAAQAGIVEEAAYRGYMFTPIERRHGPVVATVVVSLVFLLAHFNDPRNLSALRIVSILGAGVIYCVLVVITGSILPGLVAHAAGDAIGWLLSWQAAAHARTAAPRLAGIGEALQDADFLGWAGAALVLGLAAIGSFVRLRQSALREPAR